VIVEPHQYANWLDPACTQVDLFVPVADDGLRIEAR